ncbi:MAG TPA: hypothetical protein IAA90_04780 [Candidatus Ornithoclostridium excrementipullorum]|nr:hypothetical protein [Candidatus Ornithoclostridium excrementipullorum]
MTTVINVSRVVDDSGAVFVSNPVTTAVNTPSPTVRIIIPGARCCPCCCRCRCRCFCGRCASACRRYAFPTFTYRIF